jgi:hypothetical protein
MVLASAREGIMKKIALGLAMTVTLAVTASSAMTARGHAADSATSTCSSALVHYQAPPVAGLSRAPWVSAGRRADAYLLYYDAVLADGRVNQSDGAVIYTGGGTASMSTKILWVAQRSGAQAVMTGKRLDAPGAFTTRLQRVGAGRFQTSVRIPTAGCWQLNLQTATTRASAVFEAVDPPSVFSCDATPIRRDAPDPIGRQIPWLAVRPSSAGITGTIFYHLPASATGTVIYPNKHAPQNGITKILWKVPANVAGAPLIVLASRLDAPGTVPPQLFDPASDNSPGVSFPSGINVSSTGCWRLTVRSGRAAGVVVVQSIPPA